MIRLEEKRVRKYACLIYVFMVPYDNNLVLMHCFNPAFLYCRERLINGITTVEQLYIMNICSLYIGLVLTSQTQILI